MKPLVDNLLRLNTEEGRLVIVETEFEAICCLLKQRCRLQSSRQRPKTIDYVIKGVGIGNAHSIINLIRVAQYCITIP